MRLIQPAALNLLQNRKKRGFYFPQARIGGLSLQPIRQLICEVERKCLPFNKNLYYKKTTKW